MEAELHISNCTSKSSNNYLKLIGQRENLEVTFGTEEKNYMEFFVFENFKQIIVEENPKILSSSEEIISTQNDVKFKGKGPGEDGETVKKINEELNKMKRNLNMVKEDSREISST
ncbi:hypothetical protein O181_020645 [Austropuccinia psidii MF-1]|uniref:Uncharacterized protein n=1 Tax=Austropuccinia psidii MF-1 TaxID=1389203 RepID=A0A9Q3CE60_9BASI|nr:hypothetical protein [Austropuccinia psidii MF-1]